MKKSLKPKDIGTFTVLGCVKGMGLTTKSLALANDLADESSVLYITYQNSIKQLQRKLENLGIKKQPNLDFDDTISFLDSCSAVRIENKDIKGL